MFLYSCNIDMIVIPKWKVSKTNDGNIEKLWCYFKHSLVFLFLTKGAESKMLIWFKMEKIILRRFVFRSFTNLDSSNQLGALRPNLPPNLPASDPFPSSTSSWSSSSWSGSVRPAPWHAFQPGKATKKNDSQINRKDKKTLLENKNINRAYSKCHKRHLFFSMVKRQLKRQHD